MPKSITLLAEKNLHPDSSWAITRFGMSAFARRVEAIPHLHMQSTHISAQLLNYWGFLPESIESVYDLVDEIVVAHGRCPEAAEIDDGSLDRLRAVPDPDHKIRIEVRDTWRDKKAMRQFCSDHSSGNFQIVLDGDEIWVGLNDLVKSEVLFGSPRWLNLWHGSDHWG